MMRSVLLQLQRENDGFVTQTLPRAKTDLHGVRKETRGSEQSRISFWLIIAEHTFELAARNALNSFLGVSCPLDTLEKASRKRRANVAS